MQVAKRLENVNEYYFSSKLKEIDKLKNEGRDIISLAIGGPDLSPHQSVIDTLNNETNKVNQHSYQSYIGHKIFREAIADWYEKFYDVQISADKNILPLIGSKEGILHICFTFLNEGDIALVPNPGYPAYGAAVKLAGGQVKYYNLYEQNNWQINCEEIKRLNKNDLSKIKLMFVNYPHMPTGAEAQTHLFEEILHFAQQHNILIIHDNPYSFIRNKNPKSVLQYTNKWDSVIELNSLSKSHNMAGWRLGMMISNEENLKNVLKFKSNADSGMFLPLQLAAVTALYLPQEWYDQLNHSYFQREKKAIELAQILKCQFNDKQKGLFLWAKIPDTFKDCYEFCDKLLYNFNIFLTPGDVFGDNGLRYVRISLCSDVNIFNKAIDRLK